MNDLIAFDYQLFHLINGEWRNAFFDLVLPWWREKVFWVPLYLLMAIWLVRRYGRPTVYFLLAIALTITIGDQLSSSVIKPAVERLRPCREPALPETATVMVDCGGGYSFPSSHATNHFALAALLFFSWGRRWGRWRWLLWLWAAGVAYAQVYVGVHFPIDVTAGALLGLCIGYGIATLYRRWPAVRISEFYVNDKARI